jgi:hypothetical protein
MSDKLGMAELAPRQNCGMNAGADIERGSSFVIQEMQQTFDTMDVSPYTWLGGMRLAQSFLKLCSR